MMKSIAAEPLAASLPASTWVPAFPTGLLRNLAIDMAMPWLAIQLLTRLWGVPGPIAVSAAALFPAAALLANWLRRRSIDYIALLVLATLSGGIIVALVTHDLRFVMLKPVLGAAAFGLACLLSLGRRAPLMFYFARQTTAGDDTAKIAAWTAQLANPQFRRAMQLLTVVWGLAFLGKAMLWTGIALTLPPETALFLVPVLGIASLVALMTWTIAFARRGAAQIAAANQMGDQR
jgi:hypothetical protein